MRELKWKTTVSIMILVLLLFLGWYVNRQTDRIHPEWEIQMQQEDIDIVEQNPEWQHDMTEHFTKPFGPREYIRIYPQRS